MRYLKQLGMIALLGIGLVGCEANKSLPSKGSVEQGDLSINPKSVVGYVGDVMPFYDDGVMNIFYLQDGRNTHLGYHPFALMTTTDFTNYTDYGVVIPYEDDIYSQDFALGTGSIIKDKNGLYHAFYTGHNDYKNSGLPYYEAISHATSTDKINWTKIPEDTFYGNNNDFRDPYVYLGEDGYYYMLVTTRKMNIGVIDQYRSADLKNWSYDEIFYINDSGTYNMECPTFIKYNGYYYLAFSEQGSHRVTRYRYKKNLTDEWITPTVDHFDDVGFYAGRIEATADKLYAFGWCATKTGEYDYGDFDWGGNLVVHELKQGSNGLLYPKMVSTIKEKINTEVSYNTTANSLNFTSSDKKAYMYEALSDNITRISMKFEANQMSGDFGLSFATIAENTLTNLVLSFDLTKKQVLFYNDAKSFNDYGKAQLCMDCNYQSVNSVDIIIDGQILTVYVNDSVALTTRMYYMPNSNFSIYSNNCSVNIGEVNFYE